MFWTLATTVVSFLTSGIPKIIDYFQTKKDQAHELDLLKMQTERDLQLANAGYLAQQKMEEIRVEGVQAQAESQEMIARLNQEAKLGEGASQWVINARAMVRPSITYGLFLLLVVVDLAGLWYAYSTGAAFHEAIADIWDDDTQTIWASVISFWFGSQAFSRLKR
jgi:hypothetical protein